MQDLSLYLVSFMTDAGFSQASKFPALDSYETPYTVSISRVEIAAIVLNPRGLAFFDEHPDRFHSQKSIAQKTSLVLSYDIFSNSALFFQSLLR